MADDGRDTLKKLGTLHAKLLEIQEQERAIVDEIGKLLAGGPGVGAVLKRLEGHFSECWKVRYRAPYVFTYAKDVPQLKRLIRTLEVEEIERRMLEFLRRDDAFYLKARHSFGVFVHSVNDLAAVDKRHEVAQNLDLQNEAAETDRMLAGMRQRPRT